MIENGGIMSSMRSVGSREDLIAQIQSAHDSFTALPLDEQEFLRRELIPSSIETNYRTYGQA